MSLSGFKSGVRIRRKFRRELFRMRKKLEKPLLFLGMETIGDLLGDQGAVTAGAVIDYQIHLIFSLYRLVHDFCGVFNHLQSSMRGSSYQTRRS